MREILVGMKDVKVLEKTVTIRSAVKADTMVALENLAEEVVNA